MKTQRAKRYKKKCSASLTIREMQQKQWDIVLHHRNWHTLKRKKNWPFWHGCLDKGTLHSLLVRMSKLQSFEKTIWTFLKDIWVVLCLTQQIHFFLEYTPRTPKQNEENPFALLCLLHQYPQQQKSENNPNFQE